MISWLEHKSSNPGPTYSLPMGMGIMRVGIIAPGVIHLAMCILVLIAGGMEDFIFRLNQMLVYIGHLA